MNFLFAFLIFLNSSNELATSVQKPEGTVRFASNSDIKPKDLSAKYYTEQWTFHFKLNNDIQIVYTLSINDFGGFKERVGGAKIHAYWLNGKEYSISKEYPYKDFYYEKDSNEIGLNRQRPYWIKGSLDSEYQVYFKTGKNGVNYDVNLTLTDIIKGQIKGDGVYKINEHELGIMSLVTHAKVSGIVAIDGDTLNVSGIGYADHVYQNFNSSKFITSGFRFFSGDRYQGSTGHILFIPKHDIPLGFITQYSNRGLSHSLVDQYLSDEPIRVKGAKINSRYDITLENTDVFQLQINEKLLDYSIFDELSRFMKGIARRIFGAEVIEFIADGDQKKLKDTIINGFIMK
jgi:hypothetical protein